MVKYTGKIINKDDSESLGVFILILRIGVIVLRFISVITISNSVIMKKKNFYIEDKSYIIIYF